MKIQTSTDWQEIHRRIRIDLRQIGYNADFEKFVRNIDTMVSELSKIEVVSRRTHGRGTVLHTEKLEEVNAAIDRIEKLILMAKLIG
jgi:hypothetical protein